MSHSVLLRVSTLATLVCATAASTSVAQTSPATSANTRSDVQSEEIVVTAQRSGIPVWRVSGPQTTIVLVGTINGVSKNTNWDPAPLTAALLKADRVMFPGSVKLAISAFSAIGYLPKFLKFATLPKGRSLKDMMPPDQFARLIALQKRGVLKAGFERRHPLFLAYLLRRAAEGKKGLGPDPDKFVNNFARKNKLKLVPLASIKAKPLATDLFASAPTTHVPCLLDAITLAEAGPGAIKARSDAWAQRRVPDVMASTAERMFHSCWPSGTDADRRVGQNLRRSVRQILAQPQVTVAVVSLDALAERGGVLDELVSAGFDVRGPKWRS